MDPNRDNQGKRKHLDPNSVTPNYFDPNSAYEQAGHWQTKRQILSLFADDFSRAEHQEMIPGLSKWHIDQARRHETEARKGQPLPEIPSFHTRIEHEKVDHFIEYISRPEFVQDVEFGQKLSSLTRESHQRSLGPSSLHTS